MKKIKLTPVEIEFELRNKDSLLEAEQEFFDKVWYNRSELRHIRKWKPEYSKQYGTTKSTWKTVAKVAKKLEKKYGKKNMGPYDDFEWGMVSGKLSALRWVLGDEWDMLDS